MQHTKLALAEERAKWAIELRLSSLQKFYSAIEKLFDATEKFRMQQAWVAIGGDDKDDPPKWVLPPREARGGFEEAIWSAFSQTLFLEKDVQEKFAMVREHHLKWSIAPTYKEGVDQLMNLERDLKALLAWIGERYRESFENRRMGRDFNQN